MKDFYYLKLFDVYAPLLTEVQREICGQYYLYDLSLSEIAQEKGITKQAVSDTLKTCREQLCYYEEKLRHSALLESVTEALEAFGAAHPEFTEEIQAIAAKVTVGEADLDKEE